MKTSTRNREQRSDDFTAALREWGEWNRRGAPAMKMALATGFRVFFE